MKNEDPIIDRNRLECVVSPPAQLLAAQRTERQTNISTCRHTPGYEGKFSGKPSPGMWQFCVCIGFEKSRLDAWVQDRLISFPSEERSGTQP